MWNWFSSYPGFLREGQCINLRASVSTRKQQTELSELGAGRCPAPALLRTGLFWEESSLLNFTLMPSSSNVHRTKPSSTTITAPSLSSVSPEAFPLSGPGKQPQTFSLKASFPLSRVKRSKGKSFLVENLWLTRLPGADTLTDTAAGNSSCPEGCHGPPEPPAAPRAAPCGQCSIVPPRGTPGTFFSAHWQCSGFSW